MDLFEQAQRPVAAWSRVVLVVDPNPFPGRAGKVVYGVAEIEISTTSTTPPMRNPITSGSCHGAEEVLAFFRDVASPTEHLTLSSGPLWRLVVSRARALGNCAQ